MKAPLATLLTLVACLPVDAAAPPFRTPAGASRRARVQAIRDRTGWAFVRCREMADTMTPEQIETAIRASEGAQQ